MKEEKIVNLGYKYKLYLNKDQMNILNHQMYIYNQAYNICLNLWQKKIAKIKICLKKIEYLEMLLVMILLSKEH